MPQVSSPFFNISYGWALGEDGWGDPVNLNFQVMSYLDKGAVDDIVSSLPSSPANGYSVINTTDNQIYVRFGSNWIFITPQQGMELSKNLDNTTWKFNGTSWVEVTRPTKAELAAPTGLSLLNGIISVNTTINVPADQPSISSAMAYLRGFTIAKGAIVTVQVADGTYVTNTGIDLNHPQGSRINILGNTSTPASCVISTTSGSALDVFTISNGNTLGSIDGFTISRPTAGPQGTALLAINGAVLTTGSAISITNHYYGIAARNGSSVFCRGVTVTGAGDVGIWAFNGGFVDCQNATSTNASDVVNNLGHGIQAEYGGTVECSGATATGNRIAGIAAINGGIVRAHNSFSNNNTGAGFYIRDKSHIAINGATANTNGTWGIDRYYDGSVSGAASLTGNALGGQKPIVFLDNDVSVATIRANTGAPLIFASTGADGIRGTVNGNIAVQLGTEAGAGLGVNFVQLDAAVTGTPAPVKARGGDTNIDLLLSPKGTGNVRIGTFTSNADAPVTGYITIKDAAGNLRKLAVIA